MRHRPCEHNAGGYWACEECYPNAEGDRSVALMGCLGIAAGLLLFALIWLSLV